MVRIHDTNCFTSFQMANNETLLPENSKQNKVRKIPSKICNLRSIPGSPHIQYHIRGIQVMAISMYNQHTHTRTHNAMGCIAHSVASGKKLRSEYWLILSLITI